MVQVETVMTVLKIGSISLFILSIIFLRQGLQAPSKWKGTSRKKKMKWNPYTHFNRHLFTEASIQNAATVFGKRKNHFLAFDTDVLLEYPNILTDVSDKLQQPILISEQVRYELNRHKDRNPNLKQQARVALKSIANLHKEKKLELLPINKPFTQAQGLRPEVDDDLIIASYLERMNDQAQIIFITNDNNARTTARTTKLTALELDWETDKSKRPKEIKFRPGYAYKVISIGTFALAIGFMYGHSFVEKEIMAGSVTVEASEGQVTFSTKHPTFIEDEQPYLIKSEYDEFYQGYEIGDWGAVAVLDTDYLSAGRGPMQRSHYKVTLASWIYDDIQEKKNQLKYVLVLENGKEFEEMYQFVHSYRKEGIRIASVNSSVRFSGVNSSVEVNFNLKNEVEVDHLKEAKLRLVHKVTGEVVQTIPVKTVHKEEL
ncbi:PIN domain-containing protein [Alkalihalobacterium sp. APHAB7]|uniref:PIN domain-containing protein n=1 Tax=Alkalihalobacterium sp. APHAB7 TaxID=3402081 RepID=UPI003AAB840E